MHSNDLNLSDTLQKRQDKKEASNFEAVGDKTLLEITTDSNVTEHEGDPVIEASEIELLQMQQPGITTSSKRLDQLFGPIHGIPRRGITEFSGAPGCGKTQLCITLALNVQLPIEKGGLDGKCIYIDTEGGLMVHRVHQMAEKDNDDEQVRQKLRNIIYYRVLDPTEMIALMHQLPDILQNSPKIKLLIVDSVAYHFRFNIVKNRTRVGLIDKTGQILAAMAIQFNLAVVVTSHVSPNLRTGKLRPALGESWAQWCTKRLMLTRKRHQRFASIYDPSQQAVFMMEPFVITEKGIEDVDEETLARTNQWQVLETEKKQDNTLQQKAQQEDSVSLECTTIYDSEDIWNEHGGFTDEFLSEIPSVVSSIGSSINEEDGQDDRVVLDSQLDIQQLEGDGDRDSIAITASAIPPVSTPYLSQTLRRKQPPQSQDGSTIILSNNKKARHDEDNISPSPPPPPPIHDVKDDQSDDEWGPESDELWVALAELSSSSV